MLYVVWASDAPGRGDERLRVREAHRARLRAPAPHAVKVLQAGATLDPDADAGSATMNGTLLVVEAADIAAVRAFVDGDPYVAAGVYASVEIRPWRCGLGPLSQGQPIAEGSNP
jgi:uncharacterized protein YciI